MAAPLIQAVGKQTAGAAASLTIDPITTTTGNLLFASPSRLSDAGFADDAITDNHGNTWHKAWRDETAATFGAGGLWYAFNILGGAGHTVTATLPTGTDGMGLAVAEFATTLTTDPFIATEHTVNSAPPPDALPPLSSGLLAGVSSGNLLIGTSSVSHGDFRPVSQGFFTDDFRLGGTMGVIVSHAFVDAVGSYHYDYADAQFAIGQGSAGIATFKCTNGAIVQSFGKQGVFLAPNVVTDPVTTTTGNHLAVICTLYSTSFSGIPITDSYGNLWNQAWVDNSGTGGTFLGNAACYYAENIIGGAGHTITFTPPGGEFFFAIGSIESSGVDLTNSVDQTSHGHAATPPYLSGTTGVTSQAEELLIGGGSISSGAPLGYSIVPADWIDVVASYAPNGPATSGVLFSYRLAPADGSYDFEMNNGIGGATAFEAVGIAEFVLGDTIPFVNPETSTIQIRRMRRTTHINAEHKRNRHNCLELLAQVGVGNLTGDGVDPQVILRWSDDGGMTWSREHKKTLGKRGAYKTLVRWFQLGHARDRVYEIVIADPVEAVLVSAYLDIDMGLS